jgi:error-prone DNA polymerase
VLVRQRPGSAKSVIFFTVEDDWGVANLVVYTAVAERHRAAVVAARLILAEGQVERHEDPEAPVPVIHLIARRLTDRSDLLADLHLLDGRPDAPWPRALARADEVEKPNLRLDPRDPHAKLMRRRGGVLPPSRDFH